MKLDKRKRKRNKRKKERKIVCHMLLVMYNILL